MLGLLANSACVTKTVASTGSQIAVTFVQLPPGSLQTSGQVQLTVTVANDPTNQGVLWNASCSSTNCGSFNPPQTLSGATTVYTAPSAVPTGGNVNLTAMAAANHSVSQTITIPIVSSVTIAFTQAPQNLQAGSSEPVVAQVTGDSSGKGVTWSVTCSGSSNCGSISPMQTLSGSAATFTAPSTVPAGGQLITIIAASTADPSQQVTAVITVSPSAGIAISFTPALTPPTSMQTSGAANIAATITGDNTNAGVDWTATCTGNSGNCGTFSVTPAHTASASPLTYTAPATVPAGGTCRHHHGRRHSVSGQNYGCGHGDHLRSGSFDISDQRSAFYVASGQDGKPLGEHHKRLLDKRWSNLVRHLWKCRELRHVQSSEDDDQRLIRNGLYGSALGANWHQRNHYGHVQCR